MMQSRTSIVRWLWDIPMAIASWIIFKIVKFVIGVLYSRYLGSNRTIAAKWRVLSAETLASPLSLPVLMTKGPRWNTHAIIGTVGPFEVTKELALDGRAIAQSAHSWTAAIYSYPTYRTVDNLGSLETEWAGSAPFQAIASARSAQSTAGLTTDPWITLTLPPGRYSIGLRYYHWSETPTLPTVRVDGDVAIVSQSVAPTVNEFYKNLAQRTNWFYRTLHSYIFTMLKLRPWLPPTFVQQEYLPVGAPETHFLYDAMDEGDRLSLTLASPLTQHFDVYLTTYNRASFPLFWDVVTTPKFVSQTMPCDGFYLFRIRPKSPQNTAFSDEWLTVAIDCG